MRKKTPEAFFEAAQLTRELMALTQQFLDGGIPRQELESRLRRIDPHELRNGLASDLYMCLYDLDEVRPRDLSQHLDNLRTGVPRFDAEEFAALKLSLEDVSDRTGQPATRFFIDGLGRFEGVRFASLATGRPFFAARSLDGPGHALHGPGHAFVRTVAYPTDLEEQSAVIADLFDTLIIDCEEASYLRAPPPPIWKLMRLDDNVNTFQVAQFTGYAKARAVMAEFEAKMHKQSYWLERQNPTPRPVIT